MASGAGHAAGRPERADAGWWVAVAAGGALGTAARVGGLWLLPASTDAWPTTVFLENLLGAFLLGLLVGRLQRPGSPPWLRSPFFSTGALGSFTTFSALAHDVHALLATTPLLALGYASVSLVAGVALAGCGWWLGRRGAP